MVAQVQTVVVHDLIPYAHVADPARSIDFYRAFGFEVEGTFEHEGRIHWASLRRDKARLMIALADAPIDAHQQGVVFYLYARDIATLREQLAANGIAAGEVQHPHYMPAGEIRVEDPDGYCLLIGQIA